MANKPRPQPEIQVCPVCKGLLCNVPRNEMKSRGYIRKDGTISQFAQTYECMECKKRFEIN